MTASTHFVRLLRLLPLLLGLVAIAICLAMIDLKGISTDEGFRLGIVNGGHAFSTPQPALGPTFAEVIRTVEPHAYQPGYYLLLNSLMRGFGRQDLRFFRLINIGFLAACLAGLLSLSRDWAVWPRTFLVGLFAFNAYLFMHVLQIREYVVAVALYIWGTQLVLHLDRRVLAREWSDLGCFTGYGLLLSLGFYVQTWTVFPAIAQGGFLVLRRRPQLMRFLAHLSLSYLVVLALVWPYLRSHPQKVNVGLWERAKVTLLGQLENGFNLVLSGHEIGHDRFTALLPLAWLALIVAAVWLLRRQRESLPMRLAEESMRQGWLMLLSIAVPLVFQIAYFYKVEPLSVWPRYFVIHYFFLTWSIALSFRLLHSRSGSLACRLILVAGSLILAASAAYQVRSYRLDPYADTSTSSVSNWRVITRALQLLVRPDDIVVTSDFVIRSTLTASLPLPNRTLMLPELETAGLGSSPRLIYIESSQLKPERDKLRQRLAACGYPAMHEWPIPAGDGSGPLTDWSLLAFSRH